MGPTIFHLIFPLPKWSIQEPFDEKKALFSKTKQYHAFQIHNFLRGINYPGVKENWEEQMRAMDSKNFLELSYKNYGNIKIFD
jgi:hypothetical protein